MVKADFLKAINALLTINKTVDTMFTVGVDMLESPLITNAEGIVMLLLSQHYNEEGIDWFNWWLYEKDGDPDMKAFDEEGNEIMQTMDDLYEYLESNCKTDKN